jgi:phage anti-repressor protein
MNNIIKPQQIDFQVLIDGNTTELSLNTQSKMIDKLNNVFTEDDKKWYLASLYVHQNYHKTNDYIFNLENVFKMLGFANKGNAKKLLQSHFIEDKDYKTSLVPKEKSSWGGSAKDLILLNLETFKDFCMKANTENGSKIRNYFRKIEELSFEIASEEIEEYKKKLTEKDMLHEEETKTNRHEMFIKMLKNKNCVYIAELKDGNNLFKIGSSSQVDVRKKTLTRFFGQDLLFTDVFECQNFRIIEKNILNDGIINSNLYRKDINGHISGEVIQLSDDFNYKQFIRLVKKYTNQVDLLTPEQMLENKRLDLMTKLLEKGFDPNIAKAPIEKDLEQVPTKEINYEYRVRGRVPKGRKIQKIDPENFNSFVVYDSMIYALRSPECQGYIKQSIQCASRDNCIYKGFRWNFVENNQDPNDTSNLKPTDMKKINREYKIILKLNKEKTQVLYKYKTRKQIVEELHTSKKKVNSIIDNDEIYGDHYYMNYTDCPKTLINEYESRIIITKPRSDTRIKRINFNTKDYDIFNSLEDLYIKTGIYSKTVQSIMEKNEIYQGFIYEYC